MRLGVNIDHVATIRQARGINQPDPVEAALLAEAGGADLITVHLREDRRHIQDRDVRLLRQVVKTALNLEMAATPEMVEIAIEIHPDVVTLVPEKRKEVTTEGGVDVIGQRAVLLRHVRRMREAGLRVSLFIDPDLDAVKASTQVEADAIEIHTGAYADAPSPAERRVQLEKVVNVAKEAARLKLGVHAGHGLNEINVRPIAEIEEIEELNIGHSIVGRALMVGMERAVARMKALIDEARGKPAAPKSGGWLGL